MTTTLLVGCPVLHRDWVLPAWFSHLDAAAARADVAVEFVFTGREDDTATWDAIADGAGGRRVWRVYGDDEPDETIEHGWSEPRKHHMVAVRNRLLAAVRRVAPPAFLSLDSDLLLHPDALDNMLATLETGYWAVGAGCFMAPGIGSPSMFRRRGGRLERPNMPGVCIPVDIIMAGKLMAPAAYQIDYAYHHLGEDIGWSDAVTAAGGRLAWDNRVPSRHVWSRTHLAQALATA